MAEVDFEKALKERHGEKMYNILKNSRVAIAGLGGLGSNIAVSLVRCGVGELFLVDFDRVDITNLNRQQYFVDDIGKYKTEAIKENLKRINPYVNIKTKTIKVTEENAAELFGDYPVVCEAFDKAENKSMLVNELLEKTNSVIVSGNGMAGYENANGIKTINPIHRLYICGDGKTGLSDTNGLISARVAICANHQANKVIEILMKQEKSE